MNQNSSQQSLSAPAAAPVKEKKPKKKAAKRQKTDESLASTTPAAAQESASNLQISQSSTQQQQQLPQTTSTQQQQQQQQQAGGQSDDDDEFAAELDPEYEKYLRTRNEESTLQMRTLLQLMSPSQQMRYETYRSAAFPKAQVKKIMGTILGQNVTERMAVMVAGVLKLHVGELVESAREVMEEKKGDATGETPGALRPEHLREAYRRMQKKSERQTISRY